MTNIPDPGVPTPPVPNAQPSVLTGSDEVAAQFIAALNTAIALIPAFEPKHPETLKFVKRYVSFGDDLITSAISAVENNTELAAAKKFDVQRGRATYQFMTAFRPAIDIVDTLSANLKFTYQARKAEAIADALRLFAAAKGLGHDPASADVAAHAENMKRDLKRPKGNKTPKAGKTPAGNTPAPVPTKTPVTQ
ncbi:MAG TPA: hypothetical protein VNN08_07740 [Thermoanaerobaculia bacterium]|nr:hypothetical protein [Thermoanaerobaculia bacterium]